MKKQLLSSASALGLLFFAGGTVYAADLPDVAPVATSPDMLPYSAVFGIYGAITDGTSDTDSDKDGNGWLVGGDARVNYWLGQSFSTQWDLHGEVGDVDFDDSDKDGARVNFAVGGHLTWRNPDAGALGVFGGLTGGDIFDAGAESRYFIGLEGQAYLNDFTLYGQVGYHDLIEGDDNHAEMTEAWFARGVGRWFFTPYDKIEGEIGYNRSDSNVANQGPVTTWNWGALYEHQFMGTPVSAYAEYDGFERQDDSHNDGGTEHIFMLGAKIYFNQPDLKTADRYGPTLDLPDLIRTENWADVWH